MCIVPNMWQSMSCWYSILQCVIECSYSLFGAYLSCNVFVGVMDCSITSCCNSVVHVYVLVCTLTLYVCACVVIDSACICEDSACVSFHL